jgi:multidrug resistance efflux pump
MSAQVAVRSAGASDPARWIRVFSLSVSFLIWLSVLFFAVSALFLLVRCWGLPVRVPVSTAAVGQSLNVSVVSSIPGTSVETFVTLNSPVTADSVLCRVTNALPDAVELRDLQERRKFLEASLASLGKQREAVEQKLTLISADLQAFLDLTTRSLQASQDRVSADLQAARADLANAVRNAERLRAASNGFSAMERDEAEARAEMAAARVDSLTAELARLEADRGAVQRGFPLHMNVDFIARKADLELRGRELQIRETHAVSELAALQTRLSAVQDEVSRKSTEILGAPCDGRVTWLHASAGAVRAGEVLVRIARPVTLVEADFSAYDADRIAPGQRAVVSFATGEFCVGRVEGFDEPSAGSSSPSRTVEFPRQPGRVRVLVALDPAGGYDSLRAGVPARVAITDWTWVRFFLANHPARWALLGLSLAGIIVLILQPLHVRLVHPSAK